MGIKADLIVKNANVITFDDTNPVGESIAVLGGRILGVGSYADFETVLSPDTEVIDAAGLTVIPGLNDNHCHPLALAQNLPKVDMTGVTSLAEFFRRIEEKAKVTPAGEWISATNYQEEFFAEQREPTLAELDAAVPAHPVFIVHSSNHVGLANSLALAKLGIDENTPDPIGDEIVKKDGKLTGRLCENACHKAMKASLPQTSTETLVQYAKEMCRIYNSYGFTSAADMCFVEDRADEYDVWMRLRAEEALTLRVAAYVLPKQYRKFTEGHLPFPAGDDLFRIQGLKLILDGGASSGTSKMGEPNVHDGKTGILYFEQEELNEMVFAAHARGHQVAIHGIGDVAIDHILTAYENAQARLPRPDARHRIEHCSFCYEPLIERVAGGGFLPHFHPGFLWYFGDVHLRNFGQARLEKEFPYRTMLGRGVKIAIGSDCPVTSPDPAYIIYSAIARRSKNGVQCGETEKVTAREALESYTKSGAYFTYDEKVKGMLAPGLLADMTILNMDPTAPEVDAEPERILELKAERTLLAGKTVYTREEN
ncbi:MAG: amidohydrolase [Clostridiales Family XIII bacterium]|jgi:predicted amidohydrolase YtcJ|nr:amidohydrolase [Clostridiales Family XIII bacterium]